MPRIRMTGLVQHKFCTKHILWSYTTRYLTTAASVSPYHSRPVVFWSLLAFEHLQGQHHQRHIRCLSGVWSGTTLRRTYYVQLSKPSNATHSARPVGQPGCGCRLPQPGQLTIGEELLGYHNNNIRVTTDLPLKCYMYVWSVCYVLSKQSLLSVSNAHIRKHSTNTGEPPEQVVDTRNTKTKNIRHKKHKSNEYKCKP